MSINNKTVISQQAKRTGIVYVKKLTVLIQLSTTPFSRFAIEIALARVFKYLISQQNQIIIVLYCKYEGKDIKSHSFEADSFRLSHGR